MADNNPFDSILSMVDSIHDGNLKPIYLLVGEEEYYKFLARKRISQAVLKIRPAGVIQTYDGTDMTVSQLLGNLNSPSLFEPFRVIVVQNPPFITASQDNPAVKNLLEWIKKAAENINSVPAILICTVKQLDKRLKLGKQVKKSGTIMEFQPAKTYEMGDTRKDPYFPPCVDFLNEAGKRITGEAWMILRHRAPNNLWAVMNAIETLFLYTGSRTVVEADDIEATIPTSDEIPVFSLTEALGKRDVLKLREQLEKLLITGTSPLMINRLLSNRIRLLLLIKFLLKHPKLRGWRRSEEYWRFRKSTLPVFKELISEDKMLTNQIGTLHAYVLFLTLQQTIEFTEDKLIICLQELTRVDLALKSSPKSPQIMLETALLPLCRENSDREENRSR